MHYRLHRIYLFKVSVNNGNVHLAASVPTCTVLVRHLHTFIMGENLLLIITHSHFLLWGAAIIQQTALLNTMFGTNVFILVN